MSTKAEPMLDQDELVIEGVRFNLREIRYIEIERGNHTIKIERNVMMLAVQKLDGELGR